jgi:molybdopterin-containing oxidoreductase family iron-sulfur binding subunit
MPGQADDSVTVFLGYGRWRAGQVGTGLGFDAYRIRTAHAPWFGQGLEVVPTSERVTLASTQQHHALEGRHILQSATLARYREQPDFVREEVHTPPEGDSLYDEYPYSGYKWGMAIDQTSCVGCNACVVACQAENNVAVVGKEQVARAREMHWLRIDTYYQGEIESPETYFQPMLCQHCERAPCEVVCPVNATVHDAEGLSLQVYNRCVGTRYCSNNCPYKVRRFNFLLYSDFVTESYKLMRNPEVTVRSRGVMEKCSFCVQRIQRAKIESEKEGRPVRDGEVVTACQAACPTEAIVFGNLNDPASRVARLHQEPRGYGVLADLNTRPRIKYLASLRNPNQEIAPGQESKHG